MKSLWSSTSNDEGFLLIEALTTIAMISIVFTIVVLNHKNTATASQALAISEDFNTRAMVNMIDALAPELAGELAIGGSVSITVNSPNYLPTEAGIKHLNTYETYGGNPPDELDVIDERLIVYNNLQSEGHLLVSRTGINTFACDVVLIIEDYTNARIIPRQLFHDKVVPLKYRDEFDVLGNPIVHKGDALIDSAKVRLARGVPSEYTYSITGVITDE